MVKFAPSPPLRSQILLLSLFREKEASGGAITLLQVIASDESVGPAGVLGFLLCLHQCH